MSDSSRQAILQRIRSCPLGESEPPQIDIDRLVEYPDLGKQFRTIAEAVGASVYEVASMADIEDHLSQNPSFSASTKIASLVPEAVPGNVNLNDISDPHALADLDWVIAPGKFAVAENGAIWVPGNALPHRVLPFIPQHLVLIVGQNQIVPHMQAAYARIQTMDREFGVFIAGPSKTADIEQSLVLGAHGCRTLSIFAVDLPS